MKIAIAHFGTYFVGMPGGVEKITCEFASALAERGHEVTILYRDGKEGDPYFPLDKRVKEHNILFDHGRQIISEKLPLGLRILREGARLFSQKEAQAINARYKGRQYGRQIAAWLLAHPVDVIVSCSIPSTKYVIDDAGSQVPLVQMIHADPAVQFAHLSEVEKQAAARTKVMQILLPSGLAAAKTYFPHLPMTVIGNAIAPAEKMARLAEEKEHYVIACVGNVCDRKNQRLLADAFAGLAGEFPQWSVEFWGGDGSRYARQLKDHIRQKSMKNIFVKGGTKEVDAVYAHSDVFCLPSKSEGFPLAVGEAMAAGLPCVGLSSCFGVKDLIDDGKTGFLTEGTVESLQAALRKLMTDRALRVAMGEEGKKRIAAYVPEKIWDEWEKLLTEVARTVSEA